MSPNNPQRNGSGRERNGSARVVDNWHRIVLYLVLVPVLGVLLNDIRLEVKDSADVTQRLDARIDVMVERQKARDDAQDWRIDQNKSRISRVEEWSGRLYGTPPHRGRGGPGPGPGRGNGG